MALYWIMTFFGVLLAAGFALSVWIVMEDIYRRDTNG